MKYGYLLSIIFLFCLNKSFSQAGCGFDEVHKRKMQNDAEYRNKVNETEREIESYIKNQKQKRSANILNNTAAVYTIPVVVHVIHTGGAVGTIYNPSDAQIQGAIDYLNQVYNGTYPGTTGAGDIGLQFTLAKRDMNCNATTGINRVDGSFIPNYAANGVNASTTLGADEISVKNAIRWDPSSYYNIWIVNKIDGKDGTSGSFIAGYAYFPGASKAVDGTIMLATQMASGRKTLPHEIGHAFNLYHPFEGASGSTCPTNNNCNTEGDRVCDTDPITQPAAFVCRSGVNSCSGTNYTGSTEDNYMNYTNCYNSFTEGQKTRMLASAATIYRKSLTTSPALSVSNITSSFVSPVNGFCAPVTSSTGLSNHFAGITNVSLNNYNFASSSSRNDNGYVDNSIYCINLIPLTNGGTYTFSTDVLPVNTHYVKAWIDFNDNGVFEDVNELIHSNSNVSVSNNFNTSGSFTIPAGAVQNKALRLRVIDDLGSIADACHNPTYGQAEDYAVYISSGVLPVRFISLTGLLTHKNIQLSWTTANEMNIRNFDIEKSTDGLNFYKIGSIASQNNGTTSNNYKFSDDQLNHLNYYRIIVNENNGNKTYSNVINVKAVKTTGGITIGNPFQSVIKINFDNEPMHVKLELLNVNGWTVEEKILSNPGKYFQWNLHSKMISKGLYILRVADGNEIQTFKLIKE